jgi:ADP-ribosylglycohydrolase
MTSALVITKNKTCCSANIPIRETPSYKTYKDKAIGCWMGAAIADAMGGPIECQHYKRIAKKYPDFKDFLPYSKPPGMIKLGPGYALDSAPGNITDDTYIRLDLARFLLNNDPPYTAKRFAAWLLEHANFSNWWKVAVRPLKRIESGETTAEKAGLNHKQGGGGGWWQPIAILYAGDPKKAPRVTADLCRIWKAPLEQDILSSVVAGQAAAFKANATIDSVVEAILEDSGPLAKKLFIRAIEIARRAKTRNQLYEMLYQHCLVTECSKDIDGLMPPRVESKGYTDGFYSGILFAEQQPLALAYFVYGQGDPMKTVLTAVKGGRDADSIATNSASWLGAMTGKSVWPRKWLQTVQQANITRVNLEQTAHDLVDLALKNGTVRFDRMGT